MSEMSICMTVEKNKIPSLKEFIKPDEEIRKLVDDLELYHQFRKQISVKLYLKWRGKAFFKGSMVDYVEYEESKELFDLSTGKVWKSLISTIFLINNYSTDVPLEGFHKLKPEHQTEVMEIITKGQSAYEKLVEWIKPLNKPNVLDAIYDAVKADIGNSEYSLFQILKFSELKSDSSEGVVLHENILEIDNPSALVEYLKLQNENIKDSMIITFMRNKKYDFKPTIYIFFIWKNNLYVVDMGERRLNVDNSAGARSGGRRYYEKFEHVWLPLDILFSNKKKTKSTEVQIRDQKVFKRGNLFDIFKKEPEIRAYLDMLTYRIIDHIESPHKQVELGVTSYQVMKQLEDKSETKIEERIPLKIKEYGTSFESHNDASSYMVKKYASKVTSVVPSKTELPLLIGKRDFIEGLVKYKQRANVSVSIEKQMYLDWKKNHKEVYSKIVKFIKKIKFEDLAKLAFEGKKYPYMEYPPAFGEKYVDKKYIKVKEPKIYTEGVARIIESLPYWNLDHQLHILISKHDRVGYGREALECQVCRKTRWKKFIEIKLLDYRQFCAFFNVKIEDFPVEMKQHFHRMNEVYVGNSLLEDTDPIDEIEDLWFRKVSRNEVGAYKTTGNMFPSSEPSIEMFIPVCNRCIKKLGGDKINGD